MRLVTHPSGIRRHPRGEPATDEPENRHDMGAIIWASIANRGYWVHHYSRSAEVAPQL